MFAETPVWCLVPLLEVAIAADNADRALAAFLALERRGRAVPLAALAHAATGGVAAGPASMLVDLLLRHRRLDAAMRVRAYARRRGLRLKKK